MYNHAAKDYVCPFCMIVSGTGDVLTKPSDFVYHTDHVTAFIASHWWPHNAGHVIIVPNQHIENLFDLPLEIAGHIHVAAQQIGIAFMETYGCDGVSTRQHNGAYPMQEIWHYHLHVFPRYLGDDLYKSDRRETNVEERHPYADKLKQYFAEHANDKG